MMMVVVRSGRWLAHRRRRRRRRRNRWLVQHAPLWVDGWMDGWIALHCIALHYICVYVLRRMYRHVYMPPCPPKVCA